jgi:hypothetical protein
VNGHYGLENRELGRLNAGKFSAVLAYLVQDANNAYFVIHVSPIGGHMSALAPEQFLKLLGHAPFPDSCPFFQTGCHYRYVYASSIDPRARDPFNRKVDYAQKHFREFMEALPSLHEQVHDIYRKLGSMPDLFPSLREYGPEPLPDFCSEAPAWVDQAKVDEHRQAEAQVKQAVEKHKYFSTVEHILWGTGQRLEEAVHFVLEDMGLEVHRTPKGSTVDRMVRVPGTDLTFGFEITGLNEPIKKRSNKITQALAFLQERDASEKPVILANTFNDRSLQERGKEPDFTQDAVDLMRPYGIVGITTVSLYEIWKAMKYGGADVNSIAEDLYNYPGGEFLLARQ